jgi:hypothetical protein
LDGRYELFGQYENWKKILWHANAFRIDYQHDPNKHHPTPRCHSPTALRQIQRNAHF